MIDIIGGYVLPAAFAVLPPAMYSREAAALLLAIGLQESGFAARRQLGGPARSFWQFEVAGVRGVLEHSKSAAPIAGALAALRYPAIVDDPATVLAALEHNDVLAACFARCLLWTLPFSLPAPEAAGGGWQLYLEAWRPGKPRFATWNAHYADAWGWVRNQQILKA